MIWSFLFNLVYFIWVSYEILLFYFSRIFPSSHLPVGKFNAWRGNICKLWFCRLMQVINQQASKPRFLTLAKYGLILKHGKQFLVLTKWKINVTSLTILQWNQPSTCIPKNDIIKFWRSTEGLYCYKPKYKTGTIMVHMLEVNKSFFTDHQVAQAKLSCYNSRHWSHWESMWTWYSILKGTDYLSKPSSSCEWCYWNPKRTNCKSIQCWPMQRYYVFELFSILDHSVKAIKFRTCDFIPNRKVFEYQTALTKVIYQYTDAVFKNSLYFQWSGISTITSAFQGSNSFHWFQLANSNKHVPEAEQNNRTLQEWMHLTFHSLPFQAIPAIFIRYLAIETAEKLTFFPKIGCVSSYYSPWKFSPSSVLTMRNTVIHHNLVMSRLIMSQVQKIHKWHTHWLVYIYILFAASRAAIAYTIWPKIGSLLIIRPLWAQLLPQWLRQLSNLPRQMAWTGLRCMAKMGNCSMIPLG